jgi:hypothetical protein
MLRLLLIAPFLIGLPAVAAPSSITTVPTLELAYRDAANGNGRTIILQGSRSGSEATLSSICNADGSNCECVFYPDNFNTKPVKIGVMGISGQSNSVSCQIPPALKPERVKYVGLHLINGRWDSPLFKPQTELTLEEVIGNLNKESVRGIFRYSCERTFFEGEGVAPEQVTCMAGQHLSLITARYNFYLYESLVDSNMTYKGGDVPYVNSVCGINSVLETLCTDNSPELRYGFTSIYSMPFNVEVSMTPAPSGSNSAAMSYGYVATPDSAGVCPIGLVPARPWIAAAPTLIPGNHGINFPTNFQNQSGTLSDTMVETSQPANFVVKHLAGNEPCDVSGNCEMLSFGSATTAESANYVPNTPIVCVIPPKLLKGLFN